MFDVIEKGSHVLFTIVGFIMRVAPLGAFGAMAFTIGKYGVGSLASLAKLMGTLYATCLLFIFVVLGRSELFTEQTTLAVLPLLGGRTSVRQLLRLWGVVYAANLIGAVAFAFFPRHKSPLQLAALTAVLLAGFELVVTYWLYTYIPWFYPFAAVALLAPAVPLRKLVTQSGRDADELDRLGLPGVGARDEGALQPHVAFGRLEPDG